jgi:actin-related protein
MKKNSCAIYLKNYKSVVSSVRIDKNKTNDFLETYIRDVGKFVLHGLDMDTGIVVDVGHAVTQTIPSQVKNARP